MSKKLDKAALRATKRRLQESVVVDSNQTVLTVDLDFNELAGTYKIHGLITTRNVSELQEEREAMRAVFDKMIDDAIDACRDYAREWKLANTNVGQLGMEFRTPKQNYEASAEQAENKTNWNEESEEYEWPSKEDQDGGTDDEHNPQLSLTDPPKEARARKPRSNAAPVR